MDPTTGLHFRGPTAIDLRLPGAKIAAAANAAESLLGDAMPMTKGAPVRLQMAEWWDAFLRAPYHNKEVYPFRWPPYLITLLICFVLSVVMGTVVTVTASYPTGTPLGVSCLPVAFVTLIVLLLGMSFRAADHLPQLMAPYLVFAEMFHGHLGLIIALPMMAVMLGGAALTAPILNAIGGTNLPNYSTALRPISFWGAVAEQTVFVALCVWAFEQNTKVTHYYNIDRRETKGPVRGFKQTSIFFSLASFLAVFIGYGNGLYSVGNFVVTFGSYINTGGWNVPDTAACTLDLAWPFVGALVGWAFHLLTWNVKGLMATEIQAAVDKEDDDDSAGN